MFAESLRNALEAVKPFKDEAPTHWKTQLTKLRCFSGGDSMIHGLAGRFAKKHPKPHVIVVGRYDPARVIEQHERTRLAC